MKNITIPIILFLSLIISDIFGQYSGGDGSVANPYQIANIVDLETLSNNSDDWDKNFIQTDNIDATATASQQWNNGEGFEPIGTSASNSFSGRYDGQNYTISDLTINKPNESRIGLFGYANNGCIIKNLILSDISYKGSTYVGGIAGRLEGNSSIENCFISGEIESGWGYSGGLIGRSENSSVTNSSININISGNEYIGGLVGENRNSTISDCYSEGNIQGNANIGGLVGSNRDGSFISDCYNLSNIEGDERIGGLVGDNDNCTIQNSYNDGLILADSEEIGGICGNDRDGTILECYNTGDINGRNRTGGLVGNSLRGHISDSYNLSSVEGRDGVGGIVGDIRDGVISNSFNQGNVSGREETGGITGRSRNTPITSCVNNGNVDGEEYVGGICGDANSSSIINSYNTGNVYGSDEIIGGIAGQLRDGTIRTSFNIGEINGQLEVGGLVGNLRNNSMVENSYNTGNVIGNSRVGGFIGRFNTGFLINSYSTGEINGNSNVGGFIGLKNDGEVSNCFWDTESSSIDTSADGTGKTTAEMQTQSTFTNADWDFVDETENGTDDIWQMGDFCNNNDYPLLSWQELTEPPSTNISESNNTLTVEEEDVEYQWINCTDNSLIESATEQSFTPAENGSFAVIVSKNDCIDTSSCFTINTVSIETVNQQRIHIYPNPSSGIFSVENKHIGQHYSITDIYGRVIKKGKFSSNSMQIILTQHADGIYFLNIENEKSIKLLKQ